MPCSAQTREAGLVNGSAKAPKRAECQCTPSSIVAPPDVYEIRATIAIRDVERHGVLVKQVIPEIDAAKVTEFVISEFALLLKLLMRTLKPDHLGCYFTKISPEFNMPPIKIFDDTSSPWPTEGDIVQYKKCSTNISATQSECPSCRSKDLHN